jgi:hypothetical protein
MFPGSVASDFARVLRGWLGAAALQLLWKSSDPNDVEGFHRACDGRANTLVIVQSKEGNIFGGFAVPAWDSSSERGYKWVDDPTGLTFIFVLKNTFRDPPTRFPKNGPTGAIYCNPHRGPYFGGAAGGEIALGWGGSPFVHIQNGYVDKLGRGTATFVSRGTGKQTFSLDSFEVWAAAGPPTRCT